MVGCADNLERALSMLSGEPTTQELQDRLAQLEKEAVMGHLESANTSSASSSEEEAESAPGIPDQPPPTPPWTSTAEDDDETRRLLDGLSVSAAPAASSLTSSADRSSAQEDEDMCAVCYGIMCRPARLGECNHHFCRLCVFKCRLWEAGCPMCRAPLIASVSGVRFPSELQYDVAADAAIARRRRSEHSESAAKEAALETKLRAHLMDGLPLVMHPASIPCDANGKRRQMRIAKDTKVNMVFNDPQAQRTLMHAMKSGCVVGVVYRNEGGPPSEREGFIARSVQCRVDHEGNLRARLCALDRCVLVGETRHDADQGLLVGSVELTQRREAPALSARSV